MKISPPGRELTANLNTDKLEKYDVTVAAGANDPEQYNERFWA
jgi:hypothetical protein